MEPSRTVVVVVRVKETWVVRVINLEEEENKYISDPLSGWGN